MQVAGLNRTPYYEDGLFVDLPDTERAVTQSLAINRRVAEVDFATHIDNLKVARIKAHLADLWDVRPDSDDRYLTAAARDRGFLSIDEAIKATRPFYLRNARRGPQLVNLGPAREEGHAAHA